MGNPKLNAAVQRELETAVPIETIPVGNAGHYIVPGTVANDGRQLWGVHLPGGDRVGNFWGRDRAEAAIGELVETGSISR
jgi:hypothetical protein